MNIKDGQSLPEDSEESRRLFLLVHSWGPVLYLVPIPASLSIRDSRGYILGLWESDPPRVYIWYPRNLSPAIGPHEQWFARGL